MNKSDSERIAGYLEKHGYVLSENKDKAVLVVVTTCGVKQSAENRAYSLIYRLKKNNPKIKIVLTGCLSQRKDVQRRLNGYVDIWMPITELDSLAYKLGLEKIENNSLSGYLAINPKYNSKFSAFVPIGNGCDNFCAYCVVPHARGRETYRDALEILEEVKKLVKKGYKEITLIAQNVNSYRAKITNYELQITNKKENEDFKLIKFPDLLRMVNDIPGDFWIRFSTSHPKDMSDELIKAVAECVPASPKLRGAGKVCEHIHLPVQSGDNEILREMNRKYTREHYINLIKKIRKAVSNVCITTDIIVGFPGETEEQFNQTIRLLKEIKFYLAYISQYSPRAGTISAKMDNDVTQKEKKRREEALVKIVKKTALEENKKYLNKIVDVLIEGKNKKGDWFGKTRTYKNVRINGEALLGEFIKVKIKKAKDFGLEGEIIN